MVKDGRKPPERHPHLGVPGHLPGDLAPSSKNKEAHPDYGIRRALDRDVPTTDSARPRNWIGPMKGEVEILGDIVSPATEPERWECCGISPCGVRIYSLAACRRDVDR